MQCRLLFAVTAVLGLATGTQAQTARQASSAPSGEPRLTLSQDSWNFGTIRYLEKPELALTLSNTGSGELRILKVSTNCGCTAAQPEKFNLAPGESTSMRIIFNSRGKRGKTGADVTLETNDKSAPKKVFHLEGEVKRVIEMEPDAAVFRLVSPDEVMSIPLHILNTAPEPLQLKLGTLASGKFAAELKEIRPGREYEVVVTTKPPITERLVADVLDVSTGLVDEPRLEIAAQVVQIDRVNFLQPAMLVSGNRSEMIQSSVEIEYFGNDPNFRILRAECDDPNVSTQLGEPSPPTPDRPGRKPTSIVLMVVEFPPQTVFPAEGLRVRVFTTDPEYPELKIHATPDMAKYRELTIRGRGQSQRKTP